MDTFALVALLASGGNVESYVLDRDMTLEDCETVAVFASAESVLADPGLRIVWETAAGDRRLYIECVAERTA